ncbi:hypothetical protein C7M84_009170 [Penaeus vannamei]|uniref:Uncharacterized protein n=1 Tax=Penaeus vannamei TaxID=6689 RepID=A0A3R7MBT5_PENVA|nr:hypothetical protein C7M84_009170 [Penaeus vannamei]
MQIRIARLPTTYGILGDRQACVCHMFETVGGAGFCHGRGSTQIPVAPLDSSFTSSRLTPTVATTKFKGPTCEETDGITRLFSRPFVIYFHSPRSLFPLVFISSDSSPFMSYSSSSFADFSLVYLMVSFLFSFSFLPQHLTRLTNALIISLTTSDSISLTTSVPDVTVSLNISNISNSLHSITHHNVTSSPSPLRSPFRRRYFSPHHLIPFTTSSHQSPTHPIHHLSHISHQLTPFTTFPTSVTNPPHSPVTTPPTHHFHHNIIHHPTPPLNYPHPSHSPPPSQHDSSPNHPTQPSLTHPTHHLPHNITHSTQPPHSITHPSTQPPTPPTPLTTPSHHSPPHSTITTSLTPSTQLPLTPSTQLPPHLTHPLHSPTPPPPTPLTTSSNLPSYLWPPAPRPPRPPGSGGRPPRE